MNIFFENGSYVIHTRDNGTIGMREALIEFIEDIDTFEISCSIDSAAVDNPHEEIKYIMSNYYVGELIVDSIEKRLYSGQAKECVCTNENHAIVAYVLDNLREYQQYTKEALLGRHSIRRLLTRTSFSVSYTLHDKNNQIIECYTPDTIKNFCVFAAVKLLQSGTVFSECENKNCKKLFVPSHRSDEKYCDDCKNVGYYIKIRDDKYLSAYRTAYNTRNARKNRQSRGKSSEFKRNSENEFKKWVIKAQEELEKAQLKNIDIEVFKQILKDIKE